MADPFRSPEEWAASGRGRQLKFSHHQQQRRQAPRPPVCARSTRPGAYPALTFTPGLQSYNEVNSWFAEGMAEAGYVVLIIDPQGQGDSENCGHTPDGAQTTCPTTNQPADTQLGHRLRPVDPVEPVPLGARCQRGGHADVQPVLAERRP